MKRQLPRLLCVVALGFWALLAHPGTGDFSKGGSVGALSVSFAAESAASAQEASNTEAALLFLEKQSAALTALACDFTQETNIPLFARPVVSKGTLRYKRPGFLAWEYSEPLQEGFILAGETGFRWEDSRDKRASFTTAKDPIAAFVGRELLSWISFDQSVIRSRYEIAVPATSPLTLELTPKREDTRAVVQSLRIVFDTHGVAQTVTLSEAKGGTTVITFHNVAINPSLSDDVFR